jgi:hypothetical protein
MKKKVAFALLMGIITTGIISFSLIIVNTNFSGKTLLFAWLKSWGIAYAIVIPCILIISPVVEKIVNKLIKD